MSTAYYVSDSKVSFSFDVSYLDSDYYWAPYLLFNTSNPASTGGFQWQSYPNSNDLIKGGGASVITFDGRNKNSSALSFSRDTFDSNSNIYFSLCLTGYSSVSMSQAMSSKGDVIQNYFYMIPARPQEISESTGTFTPYPTFYWTQDQGKRVKPISNTGNLYLSGSSNSLGTFYVETSSTFNSERFEAQQIQPSQTYVLKISSGYQGATGGLTLGGNYTTPTQYTFTTSSINIDYWKWNQNNDTLLAFNAMGGTNSQASVVIASSIVPGQSGTWYPTQQMWSARSKNAFSNFKYSVWNSMIDKLQEVLYCKGLSWSGTKPTKTSTGDKTFYATDFNNFVMNLERINSDITVSRQTSGNPVPTYILAIFIPRVLNDQIGRLRRTL